MGIKRNIHFEVSERKILLRMCDLIFILATLHFLSIFFEFEYFKTSMKNVRWVVVLSTYILLLGSVFEMYNLQVASNQLQMMKSTVLTSFTTVLLYLLTPILTPVLPLNRIQILLFFGGVFFPLIVWRLFYQRFLASHRFEKRALLLCNPDDCDELVLTLQEINPHYKVVAVFLLDGTRKTDYCSKSDQREWEQDNLADFALANSISEIVVATVHTERLTPTVFKQIMVLLDKGFTIRDYTQVYETNTYRIPMQHFNTDFYRYFPFSRSNSNQLYLSFVKIIELILSLGGLVVMTLLVPFVFIGNRIGNKGSLFYSQTRVGKNGVPFEIYKFRTMRSDAEQNGAVFSTKNDVRITPFGNFLRKARIDELPQFFNILRGDMAFIGPRPERPYFVAQLAAVMPFYETRHAVKPGLTGWAQVNYSYGESIEESLIKLQYDLYYIKRRSIFLDLSIIIKTFSTVLFYRGQ
jgi:exopolysaccharide biosynthesis polyprenyl glycosylphosphotransferase